MFGANCTHNVKRGWVFPMKELNVVSCGLRKWDKGVKGGGAEAGHQAKGEGVPLAAQHKHSTGQRHRREWSPVPQNTKLKLVRSIWDYHDKDTHMCTHTRFCLQAVLNIDKTEHNQAWQEKWREKNWDFLHFVVCLNRFPIMFRCCCFVLTLLIEFDWVLLPRSSSSDPRESLNDWHCGACKDDLLNSFFLPTMTYNYKPWKICYTHKQTLWSKATSEFLFLRVDIASQKIKIIKKNKWTTVCRQHKYDWQIQ